VDLEVNDSSHISSSARPRNAIGRALDAYRRTGADPPWGDPLAPHGVAMEGWFWRITDPACGRVAIVLCGCCRGESGDWTLVGLAGAPGGTVHSAVCPPARVGAGGRTIDVPGVLQADKHAVRVTLGDDARLDARFDSPVSWPQGAFGGLGVGQGVPGLGQYWHPHVLGARVAGHVSLVGETWSFDGARGYAEKNWGGGFPSRWWWGQASGIGDDEGACVAFAGGDVSLGPVGLSPTALVVRADGELLRLVLPLARVTADASDGAWRLRARSARWSVDVEGDAHGSSPHRLPVPLPDERRLVDGPAQHFTGRLRVELRRGRRVRFRGESELAGLERGDLSAAGV
jgi:hypothetical protein